MTFRAAAGPIVVFVMACLAHDTFTSFILGFVAVGWWAAAQRAAREGR